MASMVIASANLSACSFMSDSDVVSSCLTVVGDPSIMASAADNKEDDTNDPLHEGILSKKPTSFFSALQQAVDDQDLKERCERFNFDVELPAGTTPQLVPRKIFCGASIADDLGN